MTQTWKNLADFIEYPRSGILSKEIIKTGNTNVSLFSMTKGSEITEHTSTKEGFVYVLEGIGVFNLAGEEISMRPGIFIFLKKGVVHSIKANDNLIFLLSLSN